MERYELQKLRDLPIEGVAERLGLRVTRGHKSLCPFHEDSHPSLSFNVRRNTCRCFVCMDRSMGTIDLVMRYLGKDFKQACQWLADEFNVTIKTPKTPSLPPRGEGINSQGNATNLPTPPLGEAGRGSSLEACRGSSLEACRWLADSHNVIMDEWKPTTEKALTETKTFDASRYEGFFLHPWLSDEARAFLFDERRLDPRVISWCRVSSWRDRNGIHWLQIPYYDIDGKLVGVQNRNLDYHKSQHQDNTPDAPDAPRFRFPYGSRCSIYNLPVLKLLKPGEDLWITEGCSDCWAMLSSGRKAIAIPSATLLSPKDKVLLTSLLSSSLNAGRRLHMYPDNDVPGERLFLQLKEFLPTLEHHHLPPGCKDFSDYYLTTKF